MISTIIFDADHTLYAPLAEDAYDQKFAFLAERTGVSREALAAAWQTTIAEHDPLPTQHVDDRKILIRHMLDRVGATYENELVDTVYDRFWTQVVNDLAYDDELAPMLERLQDAGIQMAIATDEHPRPLRQKLDAVLDDPTHFFTHTVTPIDTGREKPDIRFYTNILSRTGTRPGHAIMVGDSWDRDLAPAQRLGMVTVLVGGEDDRADHCIDSITDLEAVIDGY